MIDWFSFKHELMRRGISPWRDPHNYDRRWVQWKRAIIFFCKMVKSGGFHHASKHWGEAVFECPNCHRLTNSMVECRSDICDPCWIRTRTHPMEPGEWVWTRGWRRAHYPSWFCWVLGHKETNEQDEHEHWIGCWRCPFRRWISENTPEHPLKLRWVITRHRAEAQRQRRWTRI